MWICCNCLFVKKISLYVLCVRDIWGKLPITHVKRVQQRNVLVPDLYSKYFSSPQRPGMTSGARMPHQGAPMGPPGPPYGGTPPIRPGMPNPALDPNRKRPAPTQPVQPPPVQNRPRKWVTLFSDLSLCLLILDQLRNNRHVLPESKLGIYWFLCTSYAYMKFY